MAQSCDQHLLLNNVPFRSRDMVFGHLQVKMSKCHLLPFLPGSHSTTNANKKWPGLPGLSITRCQTPVVVGEVLDIGQDE